MRLWEGWPWAAQSQTTCSSRPQQARTWRRKRMVGTIWAWAFLSLRNIVSSECLRTGLKERGTEKRWYEHLSLYLHIALAEELLDKILTFLNTDKSLLHNCDIVCGDTSINGSIQFRNSCNFSSYFTKFYAIRNFPYNIKGDRAKNEHFAEKYTCLRIIRWKFWNFSVIEIRIGPQGQWSRLWGPHGLFQRRVRTRISDEIFQTIFLYEIDDFHRWFLALSLFVLRV